MCVCINEHWIHERRTYTHSDEQQSIAWTNGSINAMDMECKMMRIGIKCILYIHANFLKLLHFSSLFFFQQSTPNPFHDISYMKLYFFFNRIFLMWMNLWPIDLIVLFLRWFITVRENGKHFSIIKWKTPILFFILGQMFYFRKKLHLSILYRMQAFCRTIVGLSVSNAFLLRYIYFF